MQLKLLLLQLPRLQQLQLLLLLLLLVLLLLLLVLLLLLLLLLVLLLLPLLPLLPLLLPQQQRAQTPLLWRQQAALPGQQQGLLGSLRWGCWVQGAGRQWAWRAQSPPLPQRWQQQRLRRLRSQLLPVHCWALRR